MLTHFEIVCGNTLLSDLIERRTISDFGTNAANIIIFGGTGIVSTIAYNVNPVQFNDHPFYNFIYFYHLILPSLITGTIAILYYISHEPLRKTLWREMKYNLGLV
jgi:hypothetical protein